MPEVLLFTQQTVGLGGRKTGMVFWAEEFAKAGWRSSVVTVQLSLLSRLVSNSRLGTIPRDEINRWTQRDVNLYHYPWVAPLHPATTRFRALNSLTPALAPIYAWSLPRDIIGRAKAADIIVIESSSAVALFNRLKRLAPHAKFVYCMSDRLLSVGMHPHLQQVLMDTAERYDLIRVPATSMIADFPAGTKVAVIPQGVDKGALQQPNPSPYPPGSKNVVVAGDMMFDHAAVLEMVRDFPAVTFHFFGRMNPPEILRNKNSVRHGEVPFQLLVPFMQHADAGVAPYIYRPDLNYLAESSLKIQQYSFCKLPIVAPDFVKGSRTNIFGYTAEEEGSASAALGDALQATSDERWSNGIIDWREAVSELISLVSAR